MKTRLYRSSQFLQALYLTNLTYSDNAIVLLKLLCDLIANTMAILYNNIKT